MKVEHMQMNFLKTNQKKISPPVFRKRKNIIQWDISV